jgi:hypothetical protein
MGELSINPESQLQNAETVLIGGESLDFDEVYRPSISATKIILKCCGWKTRYYS